jgi:hypothetical protein
MPKAPMRKNAPYKAGELEVILSLAPTASNIRWFAILLDRSEDAVALVYRIAFEHGPLGKDAPVQERKIIEAKRAAGIGIGRRHPRSAKS